MRSFFLSDPALWVRVGYSILCGLLVGAERQFHKKPIDIRTSILICLGTMTFVFLGEQVGGDKDATRVLGQVVTGIGFLGAGAIITRQGAILGMTTASVVWVLAAMGSAIGFGRFSIAVSLAVVTVIVLAVFQIVEDWTARLIRPFNSKKTLP